MSFARVPLANESLAIFYTKCNIFDNDSKMMLIDGFKILENDIRKYLNRRQMKR